MTTDQPQPAQPSRRPRVAIVFGGRSSEHAVSCATAAGVLRAIDRSKYDIVPIGISRDGQWVLAGDDPARFELTAGRTPEVESSAAHVVLPLSTRETLLTVLEAGQPPQELGQVDVVFPLLHGPFGEDGTLQGFLEMSDVRYVGSGVLASAAGMDKHYMKVVFAGHGIPIGPYAVITDRAWRTDRAAAMASCDGLGYPVFVKPARAGSSMGITKVDQRADLEAAIEAARDARPESARGGRRRWSRDRVCGARGARHRCPAHLAGGRDRRARQPRLLRLRGEVPRRVRRRPELPGRRAPRGL